jgi:hypothetical protein
MMDRRTFMEKLFLALGGILFLAGCQKKENVTRFGNEDRLWKLTAEQGKVEEPLALDYAKDTPAFYRDASLGKLDPSFQPKVTGG